MEEAVRKGITHFLIKNVQGDISVLVSASKLLCEYPQCIPVGYERARLCEVVISNIAEVPMPKPHSSQVSQLVKQVWKIQDLKFHNNWMQWGLLKTVSHVKGKWISILETHYFSHQDCIPSIMKVMTVSMNWEFFFLELQNEWLLIEQHYIIPLHCCKHHLAKLTLQCFSVRGGADKSLARPGRKQATATKLGIYLTYSPRSSIHFLAHCSNFHKPLKKEFRRSSFQPGLHSSNGLCVGWKMDFCTRNFLGRGEPLCCRSIGCCFVSGS